MTSTSKVALCIGMIISFLSVTVCAQSGGPELNHFTADDISFDYPAGYSVTDQSTTDAQQFLITRKASSVQLTIVATHGLTLRSEMPAAGETFSQPIVKQVSLTLKESPERTSFQTQIGTRPAEGVRLRSKRNTAEVIWLRWSLRLIGFTLVRADADEAAASQLWQTVSSSLEVNTVIVGMKKAEANSTDKQTLEAPVLNGKALALPLPPYPPIARGAHASGTVTVQVLIDEAGNVTKAHAVEGHPLLRAAAVAAALQARFSPTLLDGEPVKVTGVIQYHFIAQ